VPYTSYHCILTSDPFSLVLRKPHTCRHLFKEVFDCLEAGRLHNELYCYTIKDVRAIAAHVSRPPASVSQLEADFQQLSTMRDYAPLPTKREARLAF
jgi:hypothetical protein